MISCGAQWCIWVRGVFTECAPLLGQYVIERVFDIIQDGLVSLCILNVTHIAYNLCNFYEHNITWAQVQNFDNVLEKLFQCDMDKRLTSHTEGCNSPQVLTEKISGLSLGAETRSSTWGCSKGPSRFDTVEDRSFRGQRSKLTQWPHQPWSWPETSCLHLWNQTDNV